MLVACWSPKGGSGTTVTAVLLALACARSWPGGVLIADLCGDVPAALGVPDPDGPGLTEWLAASPDVGADVLGRLELDVGRGVRLLPKGRGNVAGGTATRAELLASALAADERPVVADCGGVDRSPGRELATGATLSLEVLRPCYLGLRRALAAPVHPTGVILLAEPSRALQRQDVEDVLRVPIWAEVPVGAPIARAVDAGLLGARLPRPVERALERAVAAVTPVGDRR